MANEDGIASLPPSMPFAVSMRRPWLRNTHSTAVPTGATTADATTARGSGNRGERAARKGER